MFTFLLENHSLYSLFKLHWLLLCGLFAYLYMKRIVVGSLFKVSTSQRCYFFIATSLLIILKASPLDVIGTYYLFSVHVFQIAFICFVVIPLYILSMPRNYLRQFIWNYRTRFVVTILSHPWLSLIVFNGLLSIYFIPNVFTFLQAHVIVHIIYQTILVITAVFMWFVIIQPVRELQTLNYLLRAVYIFLASLILMPIGFYFVIVQRIHLPLYYEVEGAITPLLTIIYDQQLAGGILKLTQMFSYAFALLFIMLEWGRREQEKEGTIDEKHLRYVRGVVIHLDDKK